MRYEFYEGYEDIMENAFKRLSRTSKCKIKAMNYVDKLKFQQVKKIKKLTKSVFNPEHKTGITDLELNALNLDQVDDLNFDIGDTSSSDEVEEIKSGSLDELKEGQEKLEVK